jgi:hypothetical protein
MLKINNFIKTIIVFFIVLSMNGCSTLSYEIRYIAKNKEYYGEDKEYISVPMIINNKKEKLNFEIKTSMLHSLNIGILMYFIPLPPMPFIENNIDKSNKNFSLYLIRNKNYSKEFLDNLKFYLKIDDQIIAPSKIEKNSMTRKNGRKLRKGLFSKLTLDFEFPIKIKDIGRDGGTIIIEYKETEKIKKIEIPFIAEKFWEFHDLL